jgi:hypothetical protein
MIDNHVEKWTMYMLDRKGDYAFRSATRYRAVADKLFEMGLNDTHVLMDVGAGSCQFMHYLSRERDWTGRYLPVDAVLDGTNLEQWAPVCNVDFTVCIEVIEHLTMPHVMLQKIERATRYGVVATTPNPDVIDVLACDPTHVTSVPSTVFTGLGWSWESTQLFGKPDDTLVGYKVLGVDNRRGVR